MKIRRVGVLVGRDKVCVLVLVWCGCCGRERYGVCVGVGVVLVFWQIEVGSGCWCFGK